MTIDIATVLRRYDTARENAETIGADGWRTIADDLRAAADGLSAALTEATGAAVVAIQIRKLLDRADDAMSRSRAANRRAVIDRTHARLRREGVTDVDVAVAAIHEAIRLDAMLDEAVEHDDIVTIALCDVALGNEPSDMLLDRLDREVGYGTASRMLSMSRSDAVDQLDCPSVDGRRFLRDDGERNSI